MGLYTSILVLCFCSLFVLFDKEAYSLLPTTAYNDPLHKMSLPAASWLMCAREWVACASPQTGTLNISRQFLNLEHAPAGKPTAEWRTAHFAPEVRA